MVLSAVPFDNLGMPEVAPLSTGARSEHIQHTLYKGMVLPIAALAGSPIWLTVIVKNKSRNTTRRITMSSRDPRPLGGKLFTEGFFYRLLCSVFLFLVSVWY